MLSSFKDSIADVFDFQKHYLGPYSATLQDSVKKPAYFPDAFDFEKRKITLTSKGKEKFLGMVKEFSNKEDFQIVLSSMRLIREVYDKLTQDELLFLIYETYPDYTEFSSKSDSLLKNRIVRNRLLNSIFSKGIITKKRYEELKNAE